MTPEKLYPIARHVISRFSVEDPEDLIQETVLKMWLLSKRKLMNTVYLKWAMHNYILGIIRCRKKFVEFSWEPSIDEDPFVCIPLRGDKRKIVEAMIENKYHLKDASETLDWSYSKAKKVWREAKQKLRNFYVNYI